MQHQRHSAENVSKQGFKYWNATFHSYETLYGNEEMLLGNEDRNRAILKAQIANNGGLSDAQTNDLLILLNEAHEWLCRTGRQHMLGNFDMRGLHEIEETNTGVAAASAEQQQPTPGAVANESPALGQTDNDDGAGEETDRKKTSKIIITIWL